MAWVKAEKLSVDARASKVGTQLIKAEVSVQTIVKAAEKKEAALHVMGSNKWKEIQKLTLGSKAKEVLKLAKLPVRIVKQ